MPAQIEQVIRRSMRSDKSLSLLNWLELTHPSLSHSGSFMGLLCPVILILLGALDRLLGSVQGRSSVFKTCYPSSTYCNPARYNPPPVSA